MREILFRAKRDKRYCETQDWTYGVPFIDHEGDCIFKTSSSEYVVDSETVGQFTGEYDKNKKPIFEGDIVEFYFFDKGHKNTKTMYIEWRDSGFCMRELFRDYRLADDFSIIEEKIFTYRGDIRKGVYTTNNTYFVEVIGNIYDNPELVTVNEIFDVTVTNRH